MLRAFYNAGADGTTGAVVPVVLEVVPHKASIDSGKDAHDDQEAYNRAHGNASYLTLAEAMAAAYWGRWGRAGSTDLSTACVCHGSKSCPKNKRWILQAAHKSIHFMHFTLAPTGSYTVIVEHSARPSLRLQRVQMTCLLNDGQKGGCSGDIPVEECDNGVEEYAAGSNVFKYDSDCTWGQSQEGDDLSLECGLFRACEGGHSVT